MPLNIVPVMGSSGEWPGWPCSRQASEERVQKPKKYKCSLCDASYKTSSGCYYHMAKHTGRYRLRCEICDKGFMRSEKYKKHVESCKRAKLTESSSSHGEVDAGNAFMAVTFVQKPPLEEEKSYPGVLAQPVVHKRSEENSACDDDAIKTI